jgi:hypothetical protein
MAVPSPPHVPADLAMAMPVLLHGQPNTLPAPAGAGFRSVVKALTGESIHPRTRPPKAAAMHSGSQKPSPCRRPGTRPPELPSRPVAPARRQPTPGPAELTANSPAESWRLIYLVRPRMSPRSPQARPLARPTPQPGFAWRGTWRHLLSALAPRFIRTEEPDWPADTAQRPAHLRKPENLGNPSPRFACLSDGCSAAAADLSRKFPNTFYFLNGPDLPLT